MEKKALETIIDEGQKLAEKRTWIRKGYEELLEKINAGLAKIPDMKEAELEYLIREFDCSSAYGTYKRRIRVVMVFEGDAYIELQISGENEWKREMETLEEPTIETIRVFVERLPFFLAEFLEKIQARNNTNAQTIGTLKRLLEKLA